MFGRVIGLLCAGGAILAISGGAQPIIHAQSTAPMVQIFNSPAYGSVLVDARGFTLYHLVAEQGGKVFCTGACTTLWPPAILPEGVTVPTAQPGISGTLSSIMRPDGGRQITYDGWPLYTFAKDLHPGDFNGQGFKNVWFAASAHAIPLAAMPIQRLRLQITSTAGTVWGTVVVRYSYQGKRVDLACSRSSCTFGIPAGATVQLRERATDSSTWPFNSWQLRSTSGARYVVTARNQTRFKMNGSYQIRAVYVLATSGGYHR